MVAVPRHLVLISLQRILTQNWKTEIFGRFQGIAKCQRFETYFEDQIGCVIIFSYSFTLLIGDNYYDELRLSKIFINAANYH